jgi:protocatechuate 3,4-dioxygenase beta subunit
MSGIPGPPHANEALWDLLKAGRQVAVAGRLRPAAPSPCEPTRADVEGPFYKPGAPERTSTGKGLAVSGRLLGAPDCRPLSGGRIEWWHADAAGDYDDAHRGSMNVKADGTYRYTTDFPGKYPWRPLHIHVKAFATGYRPLTTQIYLRGGEKEIVSDIVLAPLK